MKGTTPIIIENIAIANGASMGEERMFGSDPRLRARGFSGAKPDLNRDRAARGEERFTIFVRDGVVAEIRPCEERGLRAGDGAGEERGLRAGDGAGAPWESDIDRLSLGANYRVIDGRGCVAVPGLVDMHVHFREPGFTHKEDIESGGEAAAAGGFTTVCCMPNTDPPVSDVEVLRRIDRRGRNACPVRLFAVAAMTMGQRGKELARIREMDAEDTLCRAFTGHGVSGISEDGKSLLDERLMSDVLRLAKELDLLVMDHAEDASMSGGHINEGIVSRALGVKGIPAEAETRIVERDIRLARETGARMHLQHISAARSVELIRSAKKELPGLTAETAPHYFALTEEAVLRAGAMAKMNPPLRTEQDRMAIIEGLADGTIDVIATDHAPHSAREKAGSLEEAPFGVSGLDTAFAVSYTTLTIPGFLTLRELADKMSVKPARAIGLDRGRIAEGSPADMMIFDAEEDFIATSERFASKGKNTPFEGMRLRGRVLYTLRDGALCFDHEAQR
ncbi:MAG: dihydroorotase [Clostridiales Family XIII bacterium]|jgi:dihydroorotase|nr:dihydroorotase [Clostridiales Family XIII bacterium]